MSSKTVEDIWTKHRLIILVGLVGAFSLASYISASVWFHRLGFPLDDAWIHQTYARNLAMHGEWAYIPGQPSAGSTAPLWSATLAIGYWIGLDHYLWTFILGWISLVAMAALGVYGFRILAPQRAGAAIWIGVLLALEWHLVWAAGSGMETLCFALIVLGVLLYLARGEINWLVCGLLIGLSVWLRPDGITLAAPAILLIYFGEQDWKKRFIASAYLASGILLLFLPYLVFNRLLAGAWWPNTFFAKQAEYSFLRSESIWKRISAQAMLPLVGVGVVLLPGIILVSWSALRRRAWGQIVGVLWFLGYVLIYAWRLPVVYQHGRYLMPAMPVYFIWSLAGLATWVQPASQIRWKRILSLAWLILIVLVLVSFWSLGLRAYALDVAVIESEMVDASLWVAGNTEPDALIAAHDIGALGYYAQRPLLDLAGLISPQVIPFMLDERKLEALLNSQGADYLVTFPGWYPYLVSRAEPLYATNGIFSPILGGENMTIYRWIGP